MQILEKENFTDICIAECTRSGQNDKAVRFWVDFYKFKLDAIEEAKKCLQSYGIDGIENMDEETLTDYIFWLAMHEFSEHDGTENSLCGSLDFEISQH